MKKMIKKKMSSKSSNKNPNQYPLVSVIIVSWNGKKWLKKCISSLINQTYKNIEVIIVDNASTDDSLWYLEKNFLKVKIVKNKKNLGFSNGINIGVRFSHGQYILVLNSDTWTEKDFVEKLFNFYNNNDYDVVAPTEKRYGKDQDFNCNITIDFLGSPAYYRPRYKRGKVFYLSGVCLFFGKDVYAETKGLDNNFFMYFEDADWFWRLSLLGKKYGYADSVFVYHAGAGSTGKGTKYKIFLWRNQNILQMIIKNYSFITLIFVLPLYLIQNIIEILFFLLILKPKISYSYIQGWIFNLMNINKILKKRSWIQKRRKVNDWQIMKKMYLGSGKFLLLKDYLNFNEK